jgi:hypothetical protein
MSNKHCYTGNSISFPTTISRRDICVRAGSLVAASAVATLASGVISLTAYAAPTQANWSSCGKCRGLFFNGYKPKTGSCPGGGGHSATGNEIALTYDDSTGPGQGDWRFCNKCMALFFNGYPSKGVCPAGVNGHEAAGYNFFLAHDRRAGTCEQGGWRFCTKCQVLHNGGGKCAAGGSHVPQGYTFVLVNPRCQRIDPG